MVNHVTAAVISGTFEILLHQMASKSDELLQTSTAGLYHLVPVGATRAHTDQPQH